MRRKRLFGALAAVMCIAASVVVLPHFLPAQSGAKNNIESNTTGGESALPPGGMASNASKLPIKKVMLFTSGVGYFQREGDVQDTTKIDLSFPVQDINDLLKSMVLRDLNGGKISTVSYDSHDPVSKTLRSFAIDLSGNPAMSEILNQARGEKVSVTWQPAGHVNATAVTGTNMGVETKEQQLNEEEVVEVEYLNVFSPDGMRSMKLTEVNQITFQNPALNNELARALEVVARSHDTQKKTVSLLCKGEGKRTVHVGYVVEHPIWKTSYRLVLGGQGKPYLQGWAMVENPTNEDWDDVQVRLVSGRPVSFWMDLYQPLYVQRPEVQLNLYANLKPPVYEGDLMDEERENAAEVQKKLRRQKAADQKSFAVPAPTAGKGGAAPGLPAQHGFADSLKQSAQAVAQGAKLGDQFQYIIDHPVSIARQKSALVPIISTDVESTRVSIYNEKTLAEHPMLGLKFKNTTDLHLMQGPITVYSEGSYAGDALIEDVQPGEERLLSYAVDLATEVKTASKKKPDPHVLLVIDKGTLHRTITMRDTKTYTVKNRAAEDKLVILEHPVRAPQFSLVSPEKPEGKTQNFYRFELKVPADETKTLAVVEEQKVVEDIVLTNASTQQLLVYIRSPSASPELKEKLQKAVDLKNKLAKTQQEISQLQSKIKDIAKEQERQRENMKVIPQTEPVYKKYLEKFLKQEEEIDSMRAQIEDLQKTANQQQQAYEEYVRNLTVAAKKD